MGGTETVEEVDEGNAAFQSSQMRDGTQVHDFLNVGLGQHGETGLTAGINVGMVTENVQSLCSNGTCGNVEHAGKQLAGDLVHIGDHQQQALGGGVGGGQSTGGQGAMYGTGGTGLGLHLHNLHGVAEDVLPAGGSPLVNVVGHGAGGSDGVNASDLSKGVADMGGSGIAVHRFEFSCQNEIPPKGFNFCRIHHITFRLICKGGNGLFSEKSMDNPGEGTESRQNRGTGKKGCLFDRNRI